MQEKNKSIIDAPAPWNLTGQGYIVAFKNSTGSYDKQADLPDSLKASLSGPLNYMMFVDYSSSDVGPYHELLYIPGQCRFADNKKRLTISRIVVSSQDSVINGQNNWGIPKSLADFKVNYGDDGEVSVEISEDGDFMAAFEFRKTLPLPLPLRTGLLPKSWVKTFVYSPEAKGVSQLGKMVSCRINPERFPDVSTQKVFACARVKRFAMKFPVSTIF